MKFYSGQHGRMLIDGAVAAKVTNWSFNTSMSPLDTTTLEDTDSNYIHGLRNTTGSCRLYYYDEGGTNSAKSLIDNLIQARTGSAVPGIAKEPSNVTLSLQVVIDAATTKQIVVEALLTSASMTMGVGEVLSADVSFQVNGAPISNSL
jgi:hypothetical protein